MNDKNGLDFDDGARGPRPLNERVVYRSNKVPSKKTLEKVEQIDRDLQNAQQCAECPRCHSIIPINNDDRASRAASSRASATPSGRCSCGGRSSMASRSGSPAKRLGSRASKLNQKVDWTQLSDRIEDWFHYADSSEQNVVLNFLKEIKEEDEDSQKPKDSVKSLENILDNLKKYRTKANRPISKSANFPKLGANNNSNGRQQNGNPQLYESSSWRVMRQLRSADLRSKYPVLPKANPDKYIHHSSVFYLPHRQAKSTFLLHPEWV